MHICTLFTLSRTIGPRDCLYVPPMEDIVHSMHQFEHEHHLRIAHTLEGTHTACPVVALLGLSVYISVGSKGTEIKIYKVTQADRQTLSMMRGT